MTTANWLASFALFVLAAAACTNKNETRPEKENPKSPLHFESGYSNVNGIKLYYEVYGAGEPLILIHGGGSTIQSSFSRIIPSLAQHYKVIALELQNHGRSGSRAIPQTFSQDADDVFKFLQTQKIQKVNFFGFSNGGHTLIELSTRHPEIVNKLVIASSPFKRDGFVPGFFDSMNGATLVNMPAKLKEEFLKVNPDSSQLQNMFERDKQRMIDFKGWTDEQIKSIMAPTLIVNGDKDVMTIENAIEMHRLISNSHLAIFPGVHGEYMGEITTLPNEGSFFDACTPIVLNFLKSN